MESRQIPTQEEAQEELTRRQDARDELERRQQLRAAQKPQSAVEEIANTPLVNGILGAGDALQSTLSAGHLNKPSSSGTAYDVGNIAGNIAPFVASEGLIGGSAALSGLSPLMRRLISSGLTSGAQAALQAPGARTEAAALGAGVGSALTYAGNLAGKLSPLLGTPVRAGLGALAGYELGGTHGAEIGGLTGAVLPTIIPSLAAKLAKSKAMEHVDMESAAPKLEAARRLSLEYLTPAEATGSPYVGAFQGSVGKTGEGSQKMYEASQRRLGSERNAITGLFDTIYTEKELEPLKKAAYESARGTNVNPEQFDELTASPIVKYAIKQVETDPVYQEKLKDVPKSSFAYLDQVKRSLNDMSESALRTGENDKARLIREQTKNLTDKMDAINPDYANARATAQREIIRNNLESKLNDKEIKGTNFYNKFLKNDTQFNKLRSSLSNVPEAQQKLDDMKLAFADLINPQTARTAAALTKSGMTQGRNFGDALKTELAKLNGQRFDTTAIELLTNPKWDEEFRKTMAIKDKGMRGITFSNLLSKVSSAGIANALSQQGNEQ